MRVYEFVCSHTHTELKRSGYAGPRRAAHLQASPPLEFPKRVKCLLDKLRSETSLSHDDWCTATYLLVIRCQVTLSNFTSAAGLKASFKETSCSTVET